MQHATHDLLLTAGSTGSAAIAGVFAQIAPQYPEVSWAFVALSGIGFASLLTKSLAEYLGKRLEHGEQLAELRSLRAEVSVYRARLGPTSLHTGEVSTP